MTSSATAPVSPAVNSMKSNAAKSRGEYKNQRQSRLRLCGNQTIEWLNECLLPWFGQEHQPEIYDLDVSEQLFACWQINATGMAAVGLSDLFSIAFRAPLKIQLSSQYGVTRKK